MTPAQRDLVYTLLGAVILADQKVRAVEIETFTALVKGFQSALKQVDPLSDEEIETWFDVNRKDIETMMAGPDSADRLTKILAALDGFEYKIQLLKAMDRIAVSDQELHPSEIDLIAVAAAYWQIEKPRKRA